MIVLVVILISTHAPRTGSDAEILCISKESARFQPTLPARGATRYALPSGYKQGDFNPRSPHGERRRLWRKHVDTLMISTHAPRTGSDKSARRTHWRTTISTHAPRTGSDDARLLFLVYDGISTHAPRTGSDGHYPGGVYRTSRHFNPRSPHGERQRKSTYMEQFINISTHAPRTGSDEMAKLLRQNGIISTHAPRTGSDSKIFTFPIVQILFQPTLPARGATSLVVKTCVP